MSDSLKDQLLGLGFKPAPVPERARGPRRKDAAPAKGGTDARRRDGTQGRGARTGGEGAQPVGTPGKGGKAGKGGRAGPGRGRGPRAEGDIDLAKAYAIRAQREKDERLQAERERQEEARLRREARARLETFMQGRVLNDPAAEIARHFPYGGKIKRIHVTADQLLALNAGELGVVQLNGRYCLVSAADLAEAEAIFPAAVALKVDPDVPTNDDAYADPKFQVPDDLVW